MVPSYNELDRPVCYFSYIPPQTEYNHYSSETPACSPTFSPHDITTPDPRHPLLAARELPITTLTNMSSKLLQLQTAAAHGHSPSRPRPQPMQNVLHVGSDDSDSSSSSLTSRASIDSTSYAVERCSRCQRTASIDIQTGKSNMIRIGMNSWYCNRCAAIVGFSGVR